MKPPSERCGYECHKGHSEQPTGFCQRVAGHAGKHDSGYAAPEVRLVVCARCGVEFFTTSTVARWCGRRCKTNGSREVRSAQMRDQVCVKCGAVFPVRTRSQARYCSWRCKQNAKTAREDGARPTGKKQVAADKRAIDIIKSTTPCSDCGGKFPPECMDFDHVPGRGEKVAPVSHLLGTDGLMAELAKCDLVCANCHRIRTRQRRENG